MRVYLHIGFHKTATTFLQERFFPVLENITYLGRPWRNKELHRLFLKYNFLGSLDFDPNRFRSSFDQIAADLAVGPDAPVVVSHESLHSGSDWFGYNLETMAERIKAVFPDAKIILGIRNQTDYIESNYKSYVVLGGKLRFQEFLYRSHVAQNCLLPKLKYDRALTCYWNRFGRENVSVYLLEDLKRDMNAVLSDISSYMNVAPPLRIEPSSVNPGLTSASIRFLRIVNTAIAKDFQEQYYRRLTGEISSVELLRWRLRRVLPNGANRNGSRSLLSDHDQAYIHKYFQGSNERLCSFLGRDLNCLGYYCRPENAE